MASRWEQREPNTAYLPQHMIPYVPHPSAINAWMCFGWNGIGTLYTFTETLDGQYMVSILNTCLLESARKLLDIDREPKQWYFQMDNDPKHTDKRAKAWLHNHGITVLDWPSQSPDMNPTEALISDVKRRVAEHNCSNAKELQDAVHYEWEHTDLHFIHKLIRSMPRRCKAVIEAQGFHTKY